ncbi:uncharacterized protein G2W53_044468 [Senna tora]|uniref:Uncharacterized protein n=1 Tax=Senna tora TaxID=362788 RepID=A0A834SD98_9FABA|nr:uncharacterized protein G2W53_044468 [Senna tora]
MAPGRDQGLAPSTQKLKNVKERSAMAATSTHMGRDLKFEFSKSKQWGRHGFKIKT